MFHTDSSTLPDPMRSTMVNLTTVREWVDSLPKEARGMMILHLEEFELEAQQSVVECWKYRKDHGEF